MSRAPGSSSASDPNSASARDRAPRSPWDVWGKRKGLKGGTYPLPCHLFDAGHAATIIFDSVLSVGQRELVARALTEADIATARTLTGLLAAWHDIGKATPFFSANDPQAHADTGASPWSREGEALPTHAVAGYLHFLEYARSRGLMSPLMNLVGQVIGGHHGYYGEQFEAHPGKPLSGRYGSAMHGQCETEGEWAALRTDTMGTVADLLFPEIAWRTVLASLAAPVTEEAQVAVLLVTGTVIVADWMVSDTEDFLSADVVEALPSSWELASATAWAHGQRPRIARRLDDCGLRGADFEPRSFVEHFPAITETRGVQQFVARTLTDLGPGLVILMAPTGDGKSEAAFHAAAVLGFATGASGFLMALPTMATTNELFGRAADFGNRAFRSRTRITLMHSLAYCRDTYTEMRVRKATPQGLLEPTFGGGCGQHDDESTSSQPLTEVTDWLLGHRRGLLAPNTVCTIDQILALAIASKWMPLRFLGVTRKVVILDEAHSYDAHMQLLVERLLAWLAASGVPVVAMSATLTTESLNRLANAYRKGLPSINGQGTYHYQIGKSDVHYPGWVHVNTSGGMNTGSSPTSRVGTTRVDLYEYPKERGFGRHDHLCASVGAAVEPILSGAEGNALVICNTVPAAVAVFESLRAEVTRLGLDVHVEVVHARFPNRQRKEKADRLRATYGPRSTTRPRASILVATQVAEQSLDIDLDICVSQLAPMAQLLQRDGREHRHPLSRPTGYAEPRLVVLAEGHEDCLVEHDGFPYDQILLEQSWRVLNQRAEHGSLQVRVPEDVQDLMDDAYSDYWLTDDSLAGVHLSASAREKQASTVASLKAIPAPWALKGLRHLTAQVDVDPDYSARYDMNAVSMLPVWRDTDGGLRMESPSGPRLPLRAPFAVATINAVNDNAISVSPTTSWGSDLFKESECLKPSDWQRNSTLRNITLTLMTSDAAQVPGRSNAQLGRALLRLDPDTGLTVQVQ